MQYQIIKQLNYLSRDNFSRGAYMYAEDLPTVEVYPCPQPMQHTHVTEYGVYQPAPSFSLFPAAAVDNTPPTYESTVVSAYPVETAPSAPSGLDDGYASDAAIRTFSDAEPPRPSLHHRASAAELELNRLQEELLCAICEERRKDTVFQCGHETCRTCADSLSHCPSCRVEIQVRIKRFG